MTEEKLLVVTELPTQKVNKAIGEDGNEYTLVTANEALKEILESVRDIKKLVG